MPQPEMNSSGTCQPANGDVPDAGIMSSMLLFLVRSLFSPPTLFELRQESAHEGHIGLLDIALTCGGGEVYVCVCFLHVCVCVCVYVCV